jgi:hypothetical protein
MTYIDVQWLHSNADYPIRLLSELDDDRREIRKLELYANGRVGHATAISNSGDTMLSTEPLPTIEAINLQKEFDGTEIDGQSFEKLWGQYVVRNT